MLSAKPVTKPAHGPMADRAITAAIPMPHRPQKPALRRSCRFSKYWPSACV